MVLADLGIIFAVIWCIIGTICVAWGNKQELKHNPKPSTLKWNEGITLFAILIWPLALYFLSDYRETICSQCDSKVPSKAKFCPRCGKAKE